MTYQTKQPIPLAAKLKIADLYIKQLKGEIGILESEKDELQYELDKLKKEFKEFKNGIHTTKLTKGERKQIKKNEIVKGLRAQNSSLREQVKKLTNTKDALITKLIKQNN